MPQDPICGMTVKESSLLKLMYQGTTYFFCSEHCVKKFKREYAIAEEEADSCSSCGRRWWTNKIYIPVAIILLVIGLSNIFPLLAPFRNVLIMYFQSIWWALLLGLVIGGIVDYYVPREYFSHILARPRKRTVFYSVMLGTLMSVCNHGILALSIQLYKKGASTSAVVAFLLASPWANFPITLLMIGFFGWIRASYIIFSAIIIAITTGFVFQILEGKGLTERNPNSQLLDENYSVLADINRRRKNYKFSQEQLRSDIKGILEGVVSLSNMVLWWILIGIILAGFSGAYIPQSIFRNYMGPTIAGLFVTLGVATILEVCSEGMAPLAFEIFKQTGAFGNSFVFLMAGVATDYTEIGLLWQNIGKRTALWLPVVTVPQIVFYGILANHIFRV